MRVLITGAAGFLGRHFSRYHDSVGDELVCVDNLSNEYANFVVRNARNEVRDVVDWLNGDTEYYDRVYHFASPVGGRVKIERDPTYNMDAFRQDSAMFRWAATMKPGLLVYPSSSAVYPKGLQMGDLRYRLRENDVRMDHDGQWGVPDAVYGMAKLVGERLAYECAERYGLNTLCIRPFSGYGEDQDPTYPFPAIMERVIGREDPLVVWGSGEQVRDWIHVEDIVRITQQRIDSGVAGYQTLNLCTGIGTKFVDLAGMAAALDGWLNPNIATKPDMPAGVDYRVGHPDKMLFYGAPEVSLEDGIRRYFKAS